MQELSGNLLCRLSGVSALGYSFRDQFKRRLSLYAETRLPDGNGTFAATFLKCNRHEKSGEIWCLSTRPAAWACRLIVMAMR
jgi:hypothetical protein